MRTGDSGHSPAHGAISTERPNPEPGRVSWFSLRSWFDPKSTHLGRWLAAINVAVIALLVGGVFFSAVDLLNELADQEGKARVQLAGAMARENLRRMTEDALTSARVLADRPTLQRLLADGNVAGIAPFVRRFCERIGADACAVFQDNRLLAKAGTEISWDAVVASAAEQGEGFLVAPTQSIQPALGATARIASARDTRVFIVHLLDDQLARRLSEHVGFQVRLLSYWTFADSPVDDFTPLHSAGLTDGRSGAMRIDALNLYAASMPVFASTGEAVALIETRLPAADVDVPVSRLTRRLLLAALILGALAVLAGIILGQLVAGPIRVLTDAASRLGRGDFSTSIPARGPAEVRVLARTMEDMRRNLVELTDTLRRREAEAQAVLGGIVEGVYAVDQDRIIRYLNPQAARLLRVDAAEAVGRFCGDVLNPCAENGERPCERNCPITQARTTGSARAVERLQIGGDVRTTVITSSPMLDGMQVQVIRDETELESVRRARDSVLANISHEFRTPLAAQLASLELLREGLTTLQPAELKELVLSLERGTVRLTRLIDNLLESVRIESGQLAIRHQDVDLAEVMEDARELVGSLLTLRGQTLEVALPPDLPHIEGDRPRLAQVFVNLLANASKFAPEGTAIRIGAQAGNEVVTAWVEDEGPGVPEVESGSIFDRFYRGPGDDPEPGGLGLGLWIVKSIVERHGGTIHASRTKEARTRFTITLPITLPAEASA